MRKMLLLNEPCKHNSPKMMFPFNGKEVPIWTCVKCWEEDEEKKKAEAKR